MRWNVLKNLALLSFLRGPKIIASSSWDAASPRLLFDKARDAASHRARRPLVPLRPPPVGAPISKQRVPSSGSEARALEALVRENVLKNLAHRAPLPSLQGLPYLLFDKGRYKGRSKFFAVPYLLFDKGLKNLAELSFSVPSGRSMGRSIPSLIFPYRRE
jgi:hypothetical protein